LITSFVEKPELHDPILVEGLPGIGFVANIACLHLINELKAKKFCEIHSSSFQALSLTADKGLTRPPINELYYIHDEGYSHDLIILFGNTQALSAQGQYELCDKILDIAEGCGSRMVITIGGLKRDYVPSSPKIYCTATDLDMLEETMRLGADKIQGRVFGVAGLLLGSAKLRGLRGFCILSETPGLYPDALAAKAALEFLSRYLGVAIDLSRVDTAVEALSRLMGHLLHGDQLKKSRQPGLI